MHFMVPFLKNEKFIGTSRVYERLKENPGKSEGHRRLALCGLGGAGYVEYM